MTERSAAEIFPPGDFVREELEARGWTQSDLADILGRPPRLVSEIISGKRAITPETAQGLADAFGTSAQLWMNLETAYQLHRLRKRDPDVTRRAKIYSFAPVKEMIRRHWIEPSNNLDVVEKQLLEFFETDNLDTAPPLIRHAARKTDYRSMTISECAWLYRARKLAKAAHTSAPFSKTRLTTLFENLRLLLLSSQEVRHVPRLLSQVGIRFIVIEPLAKTRIDGACLWLEDNPTKPIIAMSLRFDRIDWFWHTLMHELDHVQHGDGLTGEAAVDIDMFDASSNASKPDREKRADNFASNYSISSDELDDFIARIGPLYSKNAIRNFANRLRVHAGLAVGQLQFRGAIPYSHSREMLEKVRAIVTSSALTDGWNQSVLAAL